MVRVWSAQGCDTLTTTAYPWRVKGLEVVEVWGISPGRGGGLAFPDTEEATGSSPVGPTSKNPIWHGFSRVSRRGEPPFCPSGVRLSFRSESFETRHGDFVETFVEVAVDVENGAGALVTEAVGDLAGRLSFGDEHGHMGVAQMVGGARFSDRYFYCRLPVAAAEAVVVERASPRPNCWLTSSSGRTARGSRSVVP